MRELLPRVFTQVVNRGILGHYVATASLATGVCETINNFASLPPENPTVFEYYRKDLKRPSSDAWVGCSEQRLQSHWGEQSPLVWAGVWSTGCSTEILAESGNVGKRRRLPTPAARQLAKPLYGLTPVPRVRIPPSPPLPL